ncbi:hypothetical protein [Chryseobacterium sp. W4I1]|uniref:hypothetical protein n=1 Tax=Chryseobacterium sp. W4I1 TaxID=3042293 RepID=UPI00277D3EDA|nr:hypothetical protein [Chryseobacterium sp. W4I1]MDQ0783950.1 hypothetical protein [Chryseobacterium sp. W4I1]
MDNILLGDVLHSVLHFQKVSQIYTHRDIYKYVVADIDLSNLKIDIVLRNKEVFEWVIQHPEYDYKSLLESSYSNEELFRFFKIYYKDIIFKLDKYFSENYLIKLSEIDTL